MEKDEIGYSIELKRLARLKWEKQDKATFAKKSAEGYRFWCKPPGDYNTGRVYFRNRKSAEQWMKKNRVTGEIHTL